jgi:hypothetical protein
MPQYTRPDAYAEEVEQLEGPIHATKTGFGAMLAITKKGPVEGKIVRSRSFPAWQRVWGGREAAARGDAAYEAKAFFDAGGFELLTVRMCHYSDIDDKTTYTGGVASHTSKTGSTGPTSAEKITSAAPFNLEAADTFSLDIDNGGADAVTFDAAAADVTDTTTYPCSDQDGLTEKVTIDGGEEQTVTFSGATTTLAAVVLQMNAQLKYCRVEDVGSQVKITTDKKGTGASVAIGTGTCTLSWGTPNAGTGDVADIDAVTAQEFHDVLESDTSSTIAVVNADNTITMTSPTTGASSELDFTGNAAMLAKFGLSVETINGADAGATYDTLKLEAGYHGVVSPGVDGNNLSKKITQNPKHPTAGAGNDLAADASASDTALQVTTLRGLVPGSIIKIWDGTNTEYHEIDVDGVRSVVSGSTVTFFIDITTGLTNSFTAAASQIESREFDLEIYESGKLVEDKFKQMSTLDTTDNYFVTLINDESIGSEYVVATDLNPTPPGIGADLPVTDSAAVTFAGGTDETTGLVDADWIGTEAGGTGIHSLDVTREFMPFCTIGKNSAAVVHSAGTYAASRIWFEYLAFVDEGMSSTDAIAYRQNVLGLDSSYVSLYAGGEKVFDPIGAGTSPTRSISALGSCMGLRSNVDSLPDPKGGPWQSPAGEGEYGTIDNALDVATEYGDLVVGAMNEVGINVIRKLSNTSPVVVMGGRTLDASAKQRFKYINTRRFFQYAEKSIVDSTRYAVQRNNDFRLWDTLGDEVDTWLTSLMPRGAFPTPIKALAFDVKCGITDGVMTSGDRDDGNVIGEVAIAPHKPGEFIIWRFTQYESGYDVQEIS